MHVEIDSESAISLYNSSINLKTHDDSSIQILVLIMASRPRFSWAFYCSWYHHPSTNSLLYMYIRS